MIDWNKPPDWVFEPEWLKDFSVFFINRLYLHGHLKFPKEQIESLTDEDMETIGEYIAGELYYDEPKFDRLAKFFTQVVLDEKEKTDG